MARSNKVLPNFTDLCDSNDNNQNKYKNITGENDKDSDIVSTNDITDVGFIQNKNSTEIIGSKNSFLDDLIEGKEKQKSEKQFLGFYLDSEIANTINLLSRRSSGKGIRSKIVNETLREIFTSKGLLS